MGTRNLTMVISGGEVKVAQYGQWDGHLTSNGQVVADFVREYLQKPILLEHFKAKVNSATFVEYDPHIKDKWTECGAELDSDMVSFKISEKFREKYPELSRDTGADILHVIFGKDFGLHLKDSSDFASDSLMCEYAYVVDLDNEIMEVYQGFNKQKLHESERFSDFPIQEYGHCEYNQIRLVAEFPFDQVDEEIMKELESFLYPADEDEEEVV